LYSDYGLLFIPNDNESYTITASATLGEATNYGTNSGGYGLLFETVLDKNNKDTGYSLQFDRGYNGIIIRQRANGNESGPIIAVTRKDNSLIPSSKRDEWWTETHTVVLSVTAIPNSNNKSVNVWIDGSKIIDNFIIESAVSLGGNTGLRTWAGSSNGGAYFHDITIS
jgi:hypothetical protein